MPSLSFVFKKIKTTLKKSGTRMEKVADQAFKIKKEKVRNDMMQLTSFVLQFYMLHLKVLKVNNISPSFKNPLKLIITINMYLQNNHLTPFQKI